MTILILLSIVLFSFSCFIWSFYEYKQIKIKNLTQTQIPTLSKIPTSFKGKKIVFAADFQYDHYKRGINEDMLEKSLNLIMEQQPDIIILGGDYIHQANKTNTNTLAFFQKLKAPLGVYAVLGNHDYRNIDVVTETLTAANIQVLVNESVWLTDGLDRIKLGGVDDYWNGSPDVSPIIEDVGTNDFTLLISHQPDYFEEMTVAEKTKVDLTLAGHTHGGQVTFFGLWAPVVPSKYGQKYRYGLKTFDDNQIYITSGLGGSAMIFPIRFFARPEIVVITL